MDGNRNHDVMVFDCYVDMMPEEMLEGVDTSDLDFPVALLSYDKKAKTFVHDPLYTYQMLSTVTSLLKEAEENHTTSKKK
jgi:hypothetical protein